MAPRSVRPSRWIRIPVSRLSAIIRAREIAEDRQRTPIIALTANAMAHQVAEYLGSGMDSFVPKPIEVGRLFEALQQVLEDQPSVRVA